MNSMLSLLLAGLLGSGSSEAELALPTAIWQAHYARVEVELARVEHEPSSPAQRAARVAALAALREYRERADFGRFPGVEGERRHLFVDGAGRPCAVAYLLADSGESALVREIAERKNGAMLIELAVDPDFGPPLVAWLDRVGLTLAEAARIQAPGTTIPDSPPPGSSGPAPVPVSGPWAPAAPGPRSPGPGSRPGPRPPGPSSPGPGSSGPMLGGLSAVSPAPEADAVDWTVFWEFNKLTWLVPKRLQRPSWAVSPGSDGSSATAPLVSELVPLLRTATRDPDARVRAAAVVALARIAGDAALEDILSALTDAQESVRLAALLSLGAADSERAVHALLTVIHDGRPDEGIDLGPNARWTALVALGLARSRGHGEGTDAMLSDPCASIRGVDAARVQDGIVNHQLLAPSPKVAAFVRDLSGAFAPRCRRGARNDHPADGLPRALEALALDGSEEAVRELLQKLGSRDLEERRSAALGLGGVDHKLALGPLMTGFELEKEHLARGFLLISIGRHGGKVARDFLIDAYANGPRTSRPWSALALGILARADDDEKAREALRTFRAKEKNRGTLAATILASGIAQDVASAQDLRFSLTESGHVAVRSYAALALAMTGDASARGALLEALEEEDSPFARTGIVQALGYLGDSRDAEVLSRALLGEKNAELQVQVAAALGFHGTLDAARRLHAGLKERELGDVGRAAAIQALGMILDESEPFALGALSRNANYSVFREWMNLPLQSTL